MDKALDMSLDDIIKSKKTAGGGRGRGRGRGDGGGAPRGRGVGRGSFGGGRMRGMGRGPGRQVALGVNTRSSSFSIAKSFRRPRNFPWQHDLLEESLAAAGLPGIESGTKLFISNLDHGVSNDDIRELFTEVGELKRYAIHYDKNGRPTGSAEVVYAKRSDAFAAHKRYNNVQLDGRAMKIEIASPGSEVPVSARVNVGVINGKATRRVVMTPSGGRAALSIPTNRGVGQRRRGGGLRNGGGMGVGRGQTQNQSQSQNQNRGGRSGRGRGRGRGGRGKKQEKSAEELDKELENYHATDGMQIS